MADTSHRSGPTRADASECRARFAFASTGWSQVGMKHVKKTHANVFFQGEIGVEGLLDVHFLDYMTKVFQLSYL